MRILLVVICAVLYAGAEPADTVSLTVIGSGETHAMIDPCDCPVEPGGGLAQRATLLKKFTGTKLLLDAGGFSGGGIYDNYLAGRAADSMRTITILRAMGAIGYDAATIGDDDLIYGGPWLAETARQANCPLVSANCFSKGKLLVAPYVIVEKSGVRFGITGVTTQERLFSHADSCVIAPPVASLRIIWKELTEKSDFQIILSHLGEEMTRALIDSFPECTILLNGHRMTSHYPAVELVPGRSVLMQFGYEGKKLSQAAMTFAKNERSLFLGKTGWLKVSRDTPPDSGLASLIAGINRPAGIAVCDLYLMSQCPYGIPALREFAAFVDQFPGIEWNVWFIGTEEGSKLSSLHGTAETHDEMIWLAVKAVYPVRWLEFLKARSGEQATTQSAVAAMRLDSARIAKWANTYGAAALADHYRRTMRLAISASPTLYLNNAPYEDPIESRRLAKTICPDIARKPAVCASLPECFDSKQCRKKGFIGRCADNGKCIFAPDTKFTFTVVVADSTIQHPEKSVIATTAELFPGAVIEILSYNSKKARLLLKSDAPAALPYYHFAAGVAAAHNFGQIEPGLIKTGTGFTFKDGITPKNFFVSRKQVPSAVFFIDPLFPGFAQAIQTIAADTAAAARVRIAPMIYASGDSGTERIEDKIRHEEALRWLLLDSLCRSSYLPYLTATAKDPGSSYWFVHLKKTGISPDSLAAKTAAAAPMLAAHRRLIGDLGLKEPVNLLLDNCQVVTIRNTADLAGVLEKIRQRMVQ